jgi:hypothetical protein
VKTITLLAVAAILLVDVFGSKSSVAGPMIDPLVSFLVMLAVGLYGAWGRGPLGENQGRCWRATGYEWLFFPGEAGCTDDKAEYGRHDILLQQTAESQKAQTA